MSEKFFEPFDLLSAQQKFLPSGGLFERFAEAARNVTQAQITYSQALMRANAAFLSACFEQQGATNRASQKEDSPSAAARKPEFSTQ